MFPLPPLVRLRQKFEAPRVADVAGEVRAQLESLQLDQRIKPGQSVAITAGSRGIANIAVIIKAIVEHVKRLGRRAVHRAGDGQPRRRHGRRAARGARRLRHHRGSIAAARSAPAWRRSSSARRPRAFRVHFDKHAFGADHVLVCGRVKPHTGFVGDIESGLMKMMLIGLGKHEGAKIYHRAIQDYSFGQIVRSVAGRVLEPCRIVAGLAIVENAYDETAQIEAVAPAASSRRAKRAAGAGQASWMPRLPFEHGRPADHRRDRQEHQRHGHGHQRGRPQVQRPRGGRGTNCPRSSGSSSAA